MPTSPNTLLCQYRYDPLDRLIGQMQSGTPVHQRFYCKSRLATEIQGATGRSIVQAGDLLLAQQQRQGDALDTTLLATDLQRSVLQTIKPNHPRQPVAYSPYGHHPWESGLSSLLGFNGERWDPVTGCYLLGNGYRAFNPVLMRFNSPDSLSPFGKGGLNPYAYCLGDPINRGDPRGEASFYSFLKATRTITINSGSSTTVWGLQANISNKMARRAVKKMNRAEKRFEKKSHDIAALVTLDKQRNYNPLTKSTSDLQTRSANIINSDERIDASLLPKPLREFAIDVKHKNEVASSFYNSTLRWRSGYRMGTHIQSLAEGDSIPGSIRLNADIKKFAINYSERISILRNTADNLSIKKINILFSIGRY